jgi:predicted transcriptional regulator/transcriptional regulator with XRE-family HTH domain
MRQADFAAMLGISASYLSQLESDDRPLTPVLLDRLKRNFPVEWQDLPRTQAAELLSSLEEEITASLPSSTPLAKQLHRLVEQFPDFAEQFIQLSRRLKANVQKMEMLDEAVGTDSVGGGRLPWEEVRDWFQNVNNYVDPLDRLAEGFREKIIPGDDAASTRHLTSWLESSGVVIRTVTTGPTRAYEEKRGILSINTTKASESIRFHLCWQIASLAFRDEISAITRDAVVRSETARDLLAIGLSNYAAGAILMPYLRFREAARVTRHDIDRLRYLFGASFEQVCHRLSTLQRPNARGTPMFFCRVDMAGNITKRHSATRLRFARFGGACPLWVVHEAVAVPDRIHVQLAETPDTVRYVSIAKGLVKQTGSYAQRPRRFAVALGCEADFAQDFVYADGLNLASRDGATPIGASCRICPREDCDQRAFPPSDKHIAIDLNARDLLPYTITSPSA